MNEILKAVLQSNRLQQGVSDYRLLADWATAVGPRLAKWTRPLRVEHGTLVVHVENSTLLHHLTYLAPRLVTHLQKQDPATSIERVRFTLLDREG